MTSKYTDHDILFSNLDDIDDINVCKDFIVELRQRQRLMSTSNEDTHMVGSSSRHHLQYTTILAEESYGPSEDYTAEISALTPMVSSGSDNQITIHALGDTTASTIILSTPLIHKVFEYIDDDYKLLIHREGSTDEQRSKRLSIELIMRSGLEDYFEDVLLLSLIHI